MSTEPRPYLTYAPDPPSRFRWVPPLVLGFAIGGALGCLVTFALLSLSRLSRPADVAAEQFQIANVLNGVPGTGNVTHVEDQTHQLGYAGRDSGTAVHRRIRLRGDLPKAGDASTFCTQIQPQIQAELGRVGAFTTGGSSSSSITGNEHQLTMESGYYTRDGRSGHYDLELTVRNGQVEGLLILTEGK